LNANHVFPRPLRHRLAFDGKLNGKGELEKSSLVIAGRRGMMHQFGRVIYHVHMQICIRPNPPAGLKRAQTGSAAKCCASRRRDERRSRYTAGGCCAAPSANSISAVLCHPSRATREISLSTGVRSTQTLFHAPTTATAFHHVKLIFQQRSHRIKHTRRICSAPAASAIRHLRPTCAFGAKKMALHCKNAAARVTSNVDDDVSFVDGIGQCAKFCNSGSAPQI
jgi:hypothetical protein